MRAPVTRGHKVAVVTLAVEFFQEVTIALAPAADWWRGRYQSDSWLFRRRSAATKFSAAPGRDASVNLITGPARQRQIIQHKQS
jgi:hypothetical protein